MRSRTNFEPSRVDVECRRNTSQRVYRQMTYVNWMQIICIVTCSKQTLTRGLMISGAPVETVVDDFPD